MNLSLKQFLKMFGLGSPATGTKAYSWAAEKLGESRAAARK